MQVKIEKTKVFMVNTQMRMKFQCLSATNGDDKTEAVFKKILYKSPFYTPYTPYKPQNKPQKTSEWHNIHRNFEIRLSGHVIEVKEQNVPKGSYGTAVVLQTFPNQLMSWNIINQKQYQLLDTAIAESSPVKERNAEADRLSEGYRAGLQAAAKQAQSRW